MTDSNVVMPEWGFDVSPDMVDLSRLWSELTSMPAIYSFSYLEQLYINAPKTYTRLRDERLKKHCKVFNWDYDPHFRFNSNPTPIS